MKVALSSLRKALSIGVEMLVCEGRVEDVREKYPDISDEDYDELVSGQPAGSNNKYLEWSARQVDDGFSVEVIIQAVRLFDGNKQRLEKKDLNQYKEPGEIETAVQALGVSKSQQNKQVKSDADVIYKDDRFVVVRPHTKEASCKYGTGTKWCIAATASHNYFASYSESNNKFYFVIDTKAEGNTPTSKFAMAIIDPRTTAGAAVQVYNASDKLVPLATLQHHVGGAWSAIWAKIQAHIQANPDSREVVQNRLSAAEKVKQFMSGEFKPSISQLTDMIRKAELTDEFIDKVIKYASTDNNDSYSIVQALGEAASRLTRNSCLKAIQYTLTWAKSAVNNQYWFGGALGKLCQAPALTAEDLSKLATNVELASSPSALFGLVSNPSLPQETFQSLYARAKEAQNQYERQRLNVQLFNQGRLPERELNDWLRSGEVSFNEHSSIDFSRFTPDQLRLIPIKAVHSLKFAMELPNVPSDVIVKGINSVAANNEGVDARHLFDILRKAKLTTPQIEQLWIDNKEPGFRVALLQNPSIGVENAVRFATSKNHSHRFAVAHNPVLDAASLDALAQDESVSTRSAVAANPSTSASTLQSLSRDRAIAIRASVASNPSATVDTLRALTRDSDRTVRAYARKTLKLAGVAESLMWAFNAQARTLLEAMALDDDDKNDIMSPSWRQLPQFIRDLRRNMNHAIRASDFVCVFLLQNNGHARHEDVEKAWETWSSAINRQYDKSVWSVLRASEKYSHEDLHSRATRAQGNGLWWAPAGINKGAMLQLTAAGASQALATLKAVRASQPEKDWKSADKVPVASSDPYVAPTPGTPRGPKTSYKVYGRFKGHPVSTRLKGQAYVGATGTSFTPGEQAELTPAEDGKLKVKKVGSDHTQTWEPIDG